jgi:phosphoglycolate phosphatase-like HAD superfamily hydrolase
VSTTWILFDVDGTLIDTAGAGRSAVEAAFREVFRRDASDLDGVRVPYAGRTDPVIFRAVSEALGIAAERFEAARCLLFETYVTRLAEVLAEPDPRRRVLPGVAALLEALHGHPRIHVGLLTGNLERGARAKLEPFGLNAYFPTGGFASDSEDRRTIARIAADRLRRRTGADAPSHRTWVVGDTALDVDCARANGFRSLAVGTGGAGDEEMARWEPDARFTDLRHTEAVLRALDVDGARAADRTPPV